MRRAVAVEEPIREAAAAGGQGSGGEDAVVVQ